MNNNVIYATKNVKDHEQFMLLDQGSRDLKTNKIVTTIKASDTLEHQPTVWPVPNACAKPYHPGSGSHGQLFRPSLRTGSQRGRKKNSASESERRDSASEASGTLPPHQTALDSSRSP